jgi:ankyrin repeat protein
MRRLMFFIFIVLATGCYDELEAKPNLLKNLDELYANTSARELAEAAGNGDVKLIEKLASKGVDVNSAGNNGMPVLFWPLREQNKKGFQKLLEMGANPNYQWSTGSSITELVAGIEDIDYLKMVLKAGGDPNLINSKSNKPPIFQAVKFGLLDSIKILLDSGADIDNATNSAGETPIFDALALGDYRTALFLAKSGANLKVTDTWGNPVGFSLKNRLDIPESGDSNYKYYKELLAILNAEIMK